MFAKEDFIKHLNSSIESGKMSSEIYVSDLAWNPDLEKYDELSNFTGTLSRLTPKDFKQDILYRVGQMKASNNDWFLTFDKSMEPLLSIGDSKYTFFNQVEVHRRIHCNKENGMTLADIFINILPICDL